MESDLVARTVTTGERDGTPTRTVVATRTYATDQPDLWAALTDPERIPRWFLPITGDLQVGGRYQLEGNAGGTVERCDPPTSFAVTWEMGPMVSWLTVTLAPTGDGTQLELRHEAPVDPEFWDQYGPGAVGIGWDLGLMGLGIHLETGEPVDPELAAGFHATPEGLDFIRTAAASWADAAAADGDDRAAAHEAAERTVAFYTTG
jgi:uncharacterized protein YndB with AHSA1/START domain